MREVNKVINKAAQQNNFSSILSQLQAQSAQQAVMQRELDNVKQKLELASKTLAQKDQIIGSLELDLEHMIDQLVKIQHNRTQPGTRQQWMARPAPGLNTDNQVIA